MLSRGDAKTVGAEFKNYCGSIGMSVLQGQTDQHMLPFGRGNVDFTAVMKALKEIGYSGLFNYEVPGERACPLEISRAKLRYAKEIFEYLNRL